MNITFQFAELQRCDICKKYKGDIEAAQAFFKENKGKMVWSLDKITIKL